MFKNIKITFKDLLNYFSVFSLFTGAFNLGTFLNIELRLSYFIMAIVMMLWLPFLSRVNFNKRFLLFLSLIILFSLYNALIGKDTILLISRQAAGIMFNALFFYLLVTVNNKDIGKLFKVYLNIAFVISLIGVIQEISFFFKFRPGYDYSQFLPYWRVVVSDMGPLKINSILPEPSGFAILMMPAFFTAVYSIIKTDFKFLKIWQCVVIIVSVLFTFSSVGYIGIALALLILAFNCFRLRNLWLAIFAIFMCLFIVYKTIPDFSTRVYDSVCIITGKKSLDKVNYSSYALFSNAAVAYGSFKENPLFGSGLGSHEISYRRFINGIIEVEKKFKYTNAKDACSLLLRLLSETGLFGVLVFLAFLYVFYIKRRDDSSDYLWIINNSILVFFVLRLMRVGHYWAEGFFFFFWLYYFTKKNLDSEGGSIEKNP